MPVANTPGVLALLFILVMVWLRTRLHYSRGNTARLRLTGAGAAYFALVLVLLAAGWFAAPALVRHLGGAALLSATVARAAWFLAVYLACIALHRLLVSRGTQVFRAVAGEADRVAP